MSAHTPLTRTEYITLLVNTTTRLASPHWGVSHSGYHRVELIDNAYIMAQGIINKIITDQGKTT